MDFGRSKKLIGEKNIAVTIDMAPSFIKAIPDNIPKVVIIELFHVI
jgi:hypothetical protein